MAMPLQQNNTLQMLLDTFTSKSGSTTQSKSSGISATGMQDMLKSILGSTQGLAQVSSGQRQAGLYNSTVNQQLVNDLLARSSAEVSKVGTGTKTTTSEKIDPKLNPLKTLGAGLLAKGGRELLGPTVSGLGRKIGVEDYGQQLASMLGLGGPDLSSMSSVPELLAGGVGADFGSIFSGLGSELALDFGSAAIADIGFDFGSSLVADAGTEALGSLGGDILSGMGGLFGFKDGGKVPEKEDIPGRNLSEKLQARGKKFNSPEMQEHFRYLAGYPINYENMREATKQFNPPGSDEYLMRRLEGPMGTPEIVDLVRLIESSGRQMDAERLRESRRGKDFANGGRIGSPQSRRKLPGQEGPGASQSTEGNSISTNISNEAAGINSPTAASMMGLGFNALSLNPVGMVMGIANVAVHGLTGKSIAQNVLDAIMGVDGLGGLDATAGSAGIGEGVSADAANTADNSGPVGGEGSADASVSATGMDWNDGGRIPHQSGDPAGIKDTVPATIKGKKPVNLSGGEFIVPKDVVDAKGEEFFNKLIEQYHMPATVQEIMGRQ